MAEVNIILQILETLVKANPEGVFVNSLYQQYCNKGGLSKKQLEGMYAKAAKSGLIPAAKLATLEAIIKKKPTRYKSETIKIAPEPEKDDSIGIALEAILHRFPQHKMGLFLQSKYTHNEPLSEVEKAAIKRLANILLK